MKMSAVTLGGRVSFIERNPSTGSR